MFSRVKAAILPDPRPGLDHKISVKPGCTPLYGPLYNLSETELKTLWDYLETNLASGFIRRSTSPAGAPILFVKKKDGSLRLCIDYRGLNAITIQDRYPLPLIPEILDRLARARVFTRLDMIAAYNLVHIEQGQEWMMAFRTRYGNFKYFVMPFRLCNAPATFQSYINCTLWPVIDQCAIVYLDDVLIYSDDPWNHHGDVIKVFTLLRGAKLYVNLMKCVFDTATVEFLGFIISTVGIHMDSSRVITITEWPESRTLKEVQAFLGVTNFYWRFIGKYSRVAGPLTDLTGKKALTPFQLPQKVIEAFQVLKEAFMKAPLLAHFNLDIACIVETDASGFAISAILSQRQSDTHRHLIVFYSRKMIPAELIYQTGDQELLAIVAAFKTWRHYLEGAKYQIKVYSDHSNLQTFLTTKPLTRRQAWWAELLSGYDFIIYHISGKSNPADAPSQRADYAQAGENITKSFLWLATVTTPQTIVFTEFLHADTEMIKESQTISIMVLEDISDVMVDWIKATLPNDELAIDIISRPMDFPNYLRHGGLIFFEGNRVYVPDQENLRQRVLHECHDSPAGGHFGDTKTLSLVARHHHWFNLRQDVRSYVRTYDTCQRIKTPWVKPSGELEPLEAPSQSWTDISIDFVTDLAPSHSSVDGCDGILFDAVFTVVDCFTKTTHFVPTWKDIDAPQFAYLMIREVFKYHQIPASIVSDRGTLFTSNFWKSLITALGISSWLLTAFHLQTDGQTEVYNKMMEQYVRGYINWEQNDWVDLLPLVEWAYNNSCNAMTGYTPFFAEKGRHPRPWTMAELRSIDGLNVTALDHAEAMNDLHAILENTIKRAQVTQARYYNEHHKPMIYNVGDRVLLNRKNLRSQRPTRKFDDKFYGPFRITDKRGKQAYKLELPANFCVYNVFHVSLLRAYDPNTRFEGPLPPTMITDQDGDHKEFHVEKILDSKFHQRRLKYLVKWTGYRDSTWELAITITEDVPELVAVFHAEKPFKPRP